MIATFHDLAGCELELVPDAGIGLTGSNLTTWSDQSGRARHATVANAITDGFATAIGPIYAAADPAFGGKPSIIYSGGTSCLAVAAFTAVPSPCTFLVAGQDRSALTTLSRLATSRLGVMGVAFLTRWTRCGPTAGGPTDTLATLWGSSTPVATAAQRIVGADMRAPFVQCVVYRSSTSGMIVHNGCVRADRTMPALATPPSFSGLRLGRAETNTVSEGREWAGPLSLYVLYSRELSKAEIRAALDLASAKCWIPTVTGRLAA